MQSRVNISQWILVVELPTTIRGMVDGLTTFSKFIATKNADITHEDFRVKQIYSWMFKL